MTPAAAGTIVMGNTAGTGAITIGSSSAAQTTNVGTGAGVSTVNIATGSTTNANLIRLGSTNSQIAVGTAPADASAAFAVNSTTKGFLPPRMTTTQRDAITSPATGLTVFNTTVNTVQMNTGTPAAPVWSGMNFSTQSQATQVSSMVTKITAIVSGYNYDASYKFTFYDGLNATGNVVGSTNVSYAANGTYNATIALSSSWLSCRITNNYSYFGSPPTNVQFYNSANQEILTSAITNISGNGSSVLTGNMPQNTYSISFN